jgi:hypothetical protein
MGRGLVTPIEHELEAVIGGDLNVDFLSRLESQVRKSEEALDERERRLAEREQAAMRRQRPGILTRTLGTRCRSREGWTQRTLPLWVRLAGDLAVDDHTGHSPGACRPGRGDASQLLTGPWIRPHVQAPAWFQR